MLQLKNIHLAYGHRQLLDGVDLQIDAGERVALVGRNGSGKSSLMKIVTRELIPDDGERIVSDSARITVLEQEVPKSLTGSVFDVVAAGLGAAGRALAEYHALTVEMTQHPDAPGLMDRLTRAQQAVDVSDGWNLNQRVEELLDRLKLDGEPDFASLSGGQKRRVLLARALVLEPDLLLLDEPTNHLDIEAILALEEMLLSWSGSLLFITHDRAFLRRLATRIVDLDRGKLTSWPGDYSAYLTGKAKALEDEETANKLFDKKLAQEEVWIRQGIKARRTRNEGRVRALKALRQERAARVDKMGRASLQLQQGDQSGKQVIVADKISYAWGGLPMVEDFSCVVNRGDKIGIIGRNGAGKTTLLRLLLGKLEPQSGSVELGTRLQIAHFEQHRQGLRDDETVAQNVAPGSEFVTINGASRHVISYLQDFLFAPERARTPVRVLSGGERNRLLLARLFAQPANLLVMDEPTNDLDVETLELLEERLIEFDGTLLLVSHDREFLDKVVTSTIVCDGDAKIAEYVGGYSDYLRQHQPRSASAAPPAAKPATKPVPAPVKVPSKANLTQAERKELQNLPAKIEKLEQELEKAQAVFLDPDFYQKDDATQKAAKQAVAQRELEIEAAMQRWEELEAKG